VKLLIKYLALFILLSATTYVGFAQNIINAEYFYDTDPGVGNGIALSVGTPSDSVDFNATISTTGLSRGYHLLYVRTQDDSYRWSLHQARRIYINELKIIATEYFYDNDPGVGNGTSIPVTATLDSISFNATVNTTGLSRGHHLLYVRTKDNNGKWSLHQPRRIYINELKITAAEYFYDTDPGVGNGISIPVTATLDSISFNATVNTTGLSRGYHLLYLRTKDNNGKWSLHQPRRIYINELKITAAEYFYDNDPGVGNGTSIAVTATLDSISFNATVNTTGLSRGYHLLYLRTKDNNGKWSLHQPRRIYINELKITAAEYFYDNDPGVGNGNSIPVTATLDSISFNATVNTTGLAGGFHLLYLRTKDNNGKWSLHQPRRIFINDLKVTAVEVFFDTDPGVGNGYALTPGAAADSVNWNLTAIIPTLTTGTHYIYLRTKDNRGKWSHYALRDTLEIIPGALTWTGTVDHNWNLNLNWTPNTVPTSLHDIIIPDVINDPEIYTGANAVCDSMTISGSATITINNGYTLTLSGSWNNATGTVNVYGPGEMIMSGANTKIFGNAGIDKVKVSPSSGNTALASGANLSVKTALTLEENNFNASLGSVTLVSSPTETAYLNDFGSNTGTYTGNIKVQRYIPNQGFHYIGSAVNTPTLATELSEFGIYGSDNAQIIASSNCSSDSVAFNSPYGAVFEFNQNNTFSTACFQWGWNVRSAGTMQNARGFAARLVTPPLTMEIQGTPNTGTISYNSLGNSGGFGDGFHLVSNPYPSPMVWTNPSGFDGAAYFWQSSGPYQGTYQPFMSGSGHQIASQQGFIVRVGGGAANFALNNTYRTTGDPTFYKTEWYDQLLTLDVEGNSFRDKTSIYFTSNNTDGWDSQYDARKLPSNSFQPILFTTIESEKISINGLPTLSGYKAVPMGIVPGTSGQYTFTTSDLNTFSLNTTIFLQDLKTGAWHDLVQNPAYTFDAEESDDENRFIIHFNPQLTDIDEGNISSVNFYASNRNVVISYTGIKENNATATLYNLQGQQVLPLYNLDNSANKYELNTIGLSEGIYIAYVFADGKTYTAKVFVK
jgi:hydrogenase maturation factor